MCCSPVLLFKCFCLVSMLLKEELERVLKEALKITLFLVVFDTRQVCWNLGY